MNAELALAGGDGARILVVDDNEMNRDMLARRLLRQGHEVETAIHGREALSMLQASAFDLVLLDIMMPEMNGYELLEHLRGDPAFQHLPVILISALDDADSVVKGIEMGADDHLPKPFNPHILRARVGASLARKRLHDREQMHARMLEREIDIAREIQAGFLPAQLPQPDGWEIAACFEPARQVGGDFYDAFELGDGRIVFAIADVCDKGVGAALFMALFRSLLRALAERMLDAGEGGAARLGALVASVNDYIARTHGDANMFATMFVGLLDPRSGALAYVNGGHEAPALADAGGVRARLAPTGPAVGMLPGMEFTVAHAAIDAGQMLLLFTDGATDARNSGGACLGEEALLVMANPTQGASTAVAALRDAVHAHAAGTDPFDDLTLMAIARAAAPA
ncbi:SpoIIE family protein phosphatase [Luteimonas sp. 8-5]|uniref:PP2C family protein-serine/threonine phosphatase n=1 Tax=Luteimonas sp. 8-5 TaxID=3039387 RepID=UPI002437051F|nr:SpoIIE family protein phosphatase [Luteimonas sp. 8-5]MDG6348369.1 SpoIIE family protein phosphatase [Luteimonas sp. 8-5]